MSRGPRESHWLVIRRCLAIVRRLVRSPASGQELIAFVRSEVEPEAYSLDPAAARRALKRDRRYLQTDLSVTTPYDPVARKYKLSSLGKLAVLDLSDELLAALNVLYSTFEDNESPQVPVKPLPDFIVGLLPGERQRDLTRLAQVMRVEMRELRQGAGLKASSMIYTQPLLAHQGQTASSIMQE